MVVEIDGFRFESREWSNECGIWFWIWGIEEGKNSMKKERAKVLASPLSVTNGSIHIMPVSEVPDYAMTFVNGTSSKFLLTSLSSVDVPVLCSPVLFQNSALSSLDMELGTPIPPILLIYYWFEVSVARGIKLGLTFFFSRGFNEVVNGLVDDVWSLMGIDGVEDVTIAINSSPNKL
ncbi:hypothetical protein JHK86_040216 [Glycine max]|nr:hypothetical protein JHK86_040216 [Glycine max]